MVGIFKGNILFFVELDLFYACIFNMCIRLTLLQHGWLLLDSQAIAR